MAIRPSIEDQLIRRSAVGRSSIAEKDCGLCRNLRGRTAIPRPVLACVAAQGTLLLPALQRRRPIRGARRTWANFMEKFLGVKFQYRFLKLALQHHVPIQSYI